MRSINVHITPQDGSSDVTDNDYSSLASHLQAKYDPFFHLYLIQFLSAEPFAEQKSHFLSCLKCPHKT